MPVLNDTLDQFVDRGHCYKYERYTYRDGYSQDTTEVAKLSLEDLRTWGNRKEKTFWLPELLSYSDYTGCSVTRCNYDVILEDYKQTELYRTVFFEVYGSYGYKGIAINLAAEVTEETADQVHELFKALANYPLICDDRLFETEQTIFDEHWHSTYKSDFISALADKLNKRAESLPKFADAFEPYTDKVYEMSEDLTWSLFHALLSYTDTPINHETGCTVSVDLDSMIDAAIDELIELFDGSLTESSIENIFGL